MHESLMIDSVIEMIYKIPLSSIVSPTREKLKFAGGHCLNDLLLQRHAGHATYTFLC